jgi:methylenetetrahydrofolate reductase (NADPH)
MKITEIFKQHKRTFSFEFYPPKDEISALDFGINIGKLINLEPSFVTVTYGAGGSTQERTFAIVDYLHNKIGLTCMAHYTCVNASKDKIRKDIGYLKEIGIENIMLLRGDPPQGMNSIRLNPEGFNHASDLISFVSTLGDFCIGAASYPEKHLESKSIEEDIENLRKKINAGADFLVTQLFFVNDLYFDFVELTEKYGIDCRIIPGIIPVTNYKQIKKFVQLTGATIPQEIISQIEPYQDNPEKTYQIGLDFAIRQCRDLLDRGAPGIHFYTLNKSRAAVEIFESITYEIKKSRI